MSNRLDQEREERLEPARMASCSQTLQRMGYKVTTSTKEIKFTHNGNTITLWPYSGWFSGKGIKAGRGFKRLVEQLQQKN